MSERFDLKERPADLDNPDEIVAVMEAIGKTRLYRKRRKSRSGKASSIFLRELRAGNLGDTPWNRLIESLLENGRMNFLSLQLNSKEPFCPSTGRTVLF